MLIMTQILRCLLPKDEFGEDVRLVVKQWHSRLADPRTLARKCSTYESCPAGTAVRLEHCLLVERHANQCDQMGGLRVHL
jgi:hypothetical protein